jgi:serine/threonine protein phosphatase 1
MATTALPELDRISVAAWALEPASSRVPDDCVVYAIGDVHGRADLLDALHAAIVADAASRAARRRVLVWLGDYVDRGPDSRGVIDRLLAPPEGFETVALLGNHEQFLLDFLDDSAVGPHWMMNGGAETLASYDIAIMDGCHFRADRWQALSRALRDALPKPHRRLLDRLRPSHREGDYLFVHAGIRPGTPLEAQDVDDLLWIRGEFLFSEVDHGAIVVHGHTISNEPQVRPNRIGIDTGSFFSGRLTALALQGNRRTMLQTYPDSGDAG